MAGFITALRTEKIGAQRWLLIDDLIYKSDILKGRFLISRGFQTDLASIPRVFQGILPKTDLYDAPAVLHDAGYGGALVGVADERINLVKQWCDRIFLEAMLSCGVNKFKANTMYQLVKAFGRPEKHPLDASRFHYGDE